MEVEEKASAILERDLHFHSLALCMYQLIQAGDGMLKQGNNCAGVTLEIQFTLCTPQPPLKGIGA